MSNERWQIEVKGIVQGVGFRPFVYHLAQRLGLSGSIGNTSKGVVIEVQGIKKKLEDFLQRLEEEKPSIAKIESIQISSLPTTETDGFFIKKSNSKGTPDTIVLPDLATCKECLEEMMDPSNRRYRYPFTNCTNCGPRFSIIESLPYDRKNTTMKGFTMCTECQKEYDDPSDRRFHAQPNACPACGPKLALINHKEEELAQKEDALERACEAVRRGKILALKGIGGFQLIVDAANEESIGLLRERKKRKHKPFALMYPNLAAIKKHCHVSALEEGLLLSQEAPIVLLKAKCFPSPNIAPSNPYLGVMLPYSPLHHLLLDALDFPVVATSGNRSMEPICIDVKEALQELKGIADLFLIHDRPIVRPIDDSIVHVCLEKKQLLRRARGYSSIPIALNRSSPPSLAVGAHLKNTVACAKGNKVYLSQYLGDLDTEKAYASFSREIKALMNFYQIDPEIVITDSHPDYLSTKYAATLQKPLASCQHHAAHIYACMAEKKMDPPLLGVSWDGTGYGMDGTVWGGEFFLVREDFSYERCTHLRPFPLVCGEKAIKEPRFSAIGVLYEIFGEELFEKNDLPFLDTFQRDEKENLKKLLERGSRIFSCSSMGRLFDALASILGISQKATFEGNAAMQLEFLAEKSETEESYPYFFGEMIDWEPMFRQILEEIHSGIPSEEIAAKFHNTLASIIIEVAKRSKMKQVVLSGGVFQNKVLTEKTAVLLNKMNFKVDWHEEVPPNDGGIALGQIYSILGKNLCV